MGSSPYDHKESDTTEATTKLCFLHKLHFGRRLALSSLVQKHIQGAADMGAKVSFSREIARKLKQNKRKASNSNSNNPDNGS